MHELERKWETKKIVTIYWGKHCEIDFQDDAQNFSKTVIFVHMNTWIWIKLKAIIVELWRLTINLNNLKKIHFLNLNIK